MKNFKEENNYQVLKTCSNCQWSNRILFSNFDNVGQRFEGMICVEPSNEAPDVKATPANFFEMLFNNSKLVVHPNGCCERWQENQR